MKIRLILGFIGVALLVSSRAGAQPTTTFNVGSGVWSLGTNWTGGSPVAADTVNFTTSATSTVDGAFSMNILDFAGGVQVVNNSSGSIDVTTSVNYSGGTSVALNVPISGTANFYLNGGTGTVTLNPGLGSNTFSGVTEVFSNGTLADGENNSFSANSELYVGGTTPGTVDVNFNETVYALGLSSSANGTINIASGKTLTINGTITDTFPGVIAGSGNLQKLGSSTQILTGPNTYTGTTTIGAGAAIQIGNGTTSGSIASSGVSGTGDLSFAPASGSPISYSGNLTGSLHVDQQGPGTVTLSGTNTYSAATTINGGSLTAGSTSAFGGATGLSAVTINGSGTLNLGFFNNTIGSLSSSSTSSTVSIGSGATLTIASPSASTTFAGIITGLGGVTMQETGGSLTLEGANGYTGTTIVSSGELEDWGATSLAPASSVHIGSGGSLGINDNETIADLENISGSGGPVSLASGTTLTIGTGNAALAPFLGTISGSGGITINTTGINSQGLGGANTYTGVTTMNGGELFVASSTVGAPGSITSGPIGTNSLVFTADTELSSTGSNVTLANAISLGAYNLDNDDATSDLTITGPISGVGGSITWCTTNILALINANTFTGGVDMRFGTLLLGTNTSAGSGQIILDSGTALSASSGPGVSLTIGNNIDFTGSSAQLGNNDSDNLTLTGDIYGSGAVSYAGGSTGTLTLAPTSNSFGGTFTINSGTVYAANDNAFGSASSVSLTGSAALNVETGVSVTSPVSLSGPPNVLAGSGTIASPVTDNAHVVISPSASPGGGPGILTFSNGLTLANGGAIHFDIYNALGTAGTGFSSISATGGLALSFPSGSLTFNIVSTDSSGNSASAINFNPSNMYSWVFASSPTTITGTAFNPSQFNLISSGSFLNSTAGGTFGVTEVGNSLFLNFTPVPEPSTWALLGAGVLAVAAFEYRRRRQARA